MSTDLNILLAAARAAYPDAMAAEAAFMEEVKYRAGQGDLLCYGLWVHGHVPMFQKIAFSRHAYVIASQWEQHKRTATVAPPRHGKTKLMQWEMEMWIGRETERCFLEPGYPVPTCLYVMNTVGQVEDECQVIEYTLEFNKRYKALYPHVKPAKKYGWTKDKFFLQRPEPRDTPTFQGTGMFGPIQGKGYGKLGMDDGTDQKDAGSPSTIEAQKQFRFGVFADRLDYEYGQVRDILTRWHQDDIFSVLEKQPDVNSLVMPALGYWETHPEHGVTAKALWPEVWTEHRLEVIRLNKVAAGESGLWQLTYMCDPVVAEGALFKRAWLLHEPAPSDMVVVQAVDPAIGQSERADYFVVATVGIDLGQRRFHILDIYRDRIEAPDQPAAIATQYEKWHPFAIGIESIFYQAALFQTLRREGSLPVTEIPRRSGAGGVNKQMRMQGLAGRYKEKQVVHPVSSPWLEDYETELMSVQYVDGKDIHKHEDQCDAVEMCLQLLAPLLRSSLVSEVPQYASFSVS